MSSPFERMEKQDDQVNETEEASPEKVWDVSTFQIDGKKISLREEIASRFMTVDELESVSGVTDFKKYVMTLVWEKIGKKQTLEVTEISNIFVFLLRGIFVRISPIEQRFAFYNPELKLWTVGLGERAAKEVILKMFTNVLQPHFIDRQIEEMKHRLSTETGYMRSAYERALKNCHAAKAEFMRSLSIITTTVCAHIPLEENFTDSIDLFNVQEADGCRVEIPVEKFKMILVTKKDEVEEAKIDLVERTARYRHSLKWNVDLTLKETHPEYEKHVNDFIDTLLWRGGKPPTAEEKLYFARFLALSLCGFGPQEKKIFFLTGGSNNGKSTLINIVRLLIGESAVNIGDSAINVQKFETGDSTAKAMGSLVGKRLGFISEPSGVFGSNVIKRLTGGDPVSTRVLHSNPKTSVLNAGIWVLSNHVPEFADVDQALINRLRQIKFCATYVDAEQVDVENDFLLINPALVRKVSSPAGLAWFFDFIMKGLKSYLEVGLGTCDRFDKDSVEMTAPHAKKIAPDSFLKFLEVWCVNKESSCQEFAPLYEKYLTYCTGMNYTPVSKKSMGMLLGKMYKKDPSKRVIKYHGLELKSC